MCSGWRGQIPAPLGLHRVHLHYTISLQHNTLSPTVHFNGSNGTAYTRPSMVQNNYRVPLISFQSEKMLKQLEIFKSYFAQMRKILEHRQVGQSPLDGKFKRTGSCDVFNSTYTLHTRRNTYTRTNCTSTSTYVGCTRYCMYRFQKATWSQPPAIQILFNCILQYAGLSPSEIQINTQYILTVCSGSLEALRETSLGSSLPSLSRWVLVC